ncbi:MAG: succinyldiaminopimelate transaminase [Gammaproteobacteria bacterium]|nr:succinyldiaminopimelate transaminase [Gammaproteobacteria bacterium]
MNPDLSQLKPYPFERLRHLKEGISPPADLPHIPLSIGEPKHAPPTFVVDELIAHLHGLATYPTTRGSDELREAIARWATRRFGLPPDSLDPGRHVLPVNGTREALFAFAQVMVERGHEPLVLMPNPFYQIYEGAAILAGARPVYLNCDAANGFIPDYDAVPEEQWRHCDLLYICSPANPTGAVTPLETLQALIHKAHRYGFVIAADECYSEIYRDEDAPPPGLLEAASAMGVRDFEHCIVFHSLSKRSNLPGLRSGFVAGEPRLIEQFFTYRTYHGCSMSPPTQAASVHAWCDEAHVADNREHYRRKFEQVVDILAPVMELEYPAAAFYLWPRTPVDDAVFAHGLFANRHVTVLPGSYLSRETAAGNPGAGYVRMALVAPLEDCVEAAYRIRDYITHEF